MPARGETRLSGRGQRVAVAIVVDTADRSGRSAAPRAPGHATTARPDPGRRSAATIRPQVVVGVGGALAERHRRGDGRRRERHQQRRGGVVEEPGIAKVVGQLPPELGAGQQRVTDRSGRRHVGRVRLVEEVPSVRSRCCRPTATPARPSARHGSRHEVLVEAIVVAEQRAGCGS